MSQFQNIIGRALRYWFPSEIILENHRPDWLFGMELDFYLPSLSIAVEVQGIQHYRFTPKFHRSKSDCTNQRRRDSKKIELCHARKICLLVARQNKGLMLCNLPRKLNKATGLRIRKITPEMKLEWRNHARILNKLNRA